jgi:hypothetical protein
VVRDGVWQTQAGQPLEFVIVGFDGAGNQKQNGGDEITVADATVKDNGDGTYKVTWMRTAVGFHKVMITINGEVMQGTPEVDLIPAEVKSPVPHALFRICNMALDAGPCIVLCDGWMWVNGEGMWA